GARMEEGLPPHTRRLRRHRHGHGDRLLLRLADRVRKPVHEHEGCRSLAGIRPWHDHQRGDGKAPYRLLDRSARDRLPGRLPAGSEGARRWLPGGLAREGRRPRLERPGLEPARGPPRVRQQGNLLSIAALGGLLAFRMLTNRPRWLGWRSLAVGIYCTTAVLSPIWSVDPPSSIHGGLEIAKHFLFFVAVINALTTPKRIRVAIMLYAFAAIVPGWGTFWNWWHDELLVEGFRGRWLGVLADP